MNGKTDTNPIIRKAVAADIETVHTILNFFAGKGLLLPRSLSELYEHLRQYFVLKTDPEGVVQGVCGLGICWKDLAEIESLAVAEAYQGKGFGQQLVAACLKEARELELNRVFTLTYVPDFFIKLGFREIEKSCLPQKIWADCLKCPKFPNCDETALMLDLTESAI
ncbi:MAG: N-acetyltransferase [Deltaproteobacteria bacterium]|nr:N-acetyltransferase [Deltaproteobacteria bacterium]